MELLPFELMLVSVGKLPKRDTELVILRVGHLGDCAYQVEQHRRIAKRLGLADMQAKIFEGPMAPDSPTVSRHCSPRPTSSSAPALSRPTPGRDLSRHLGAPRRIEFVTLASQYDALAAMLSALNVPLDS